MIDSNLIEMDWKPIGAVICFIIAGSIFMYLCKLQKEKKKD